jgi:photosystem II stability/assembly factor-like uncharacterized protein
MTFMRIDLGLLRRCGSCAHLFLLFLAIFAGSISAEQPWNTVGPAGGDARAFAPVPGQPSHLYLGTLTGWLYESLDEGASWHRLARIDSAQSGSSSSLILDSIVVDSVDPSIVYVAGYRADRPDGGLWISRNAGKTWIEVEGLHGQAIHSLVQAPSDPKILVAGTLAGVFASTDAGATWKQISPADSKEIHEVESLAIDPADPDVIYAGTWHLPWKTTDGGKTWHSIKEGIITDSDVFSILVDPEQPRTVFLSACSGIYKSESAGKLFRKVQGIPSDARRTRVLMQDPENHAVVYAGTTEGLYKTIDAGKSFQPMTGSDVIVNDVFVDPHDSNRVLLATDRGGVLSSHDGGVTFAPSNEGFSERKVQALLVDRDNPQRMFAGVVNDKSYGGVFVSTDGGASWQQIGTGLEGRDVYTLAQTKDGNILAGTSHGVFFLNQPSGPPSNESPVQSGTQPAVHPNGVWEPRNTIANTSMKTTSQTVRGTHVNTEKAVKDPVIQLESRINALDVSGDVWLAGTSYGLLTSIDEGATWQGGTFAFRGEYVSIAVHDGVMAAARADGVVLSTDSGKTWWPMGIPKALTRIHRLVFSPDGTLWLGAAEGVYFSHDQGKSWLWIERLPFRDVGDLYYDAALGEVLVSSQASDQIYAIDPKSLKWTWSQTGYKVALIRAAGTRMVAASLDEGVLVEPQAAAAKSAGTE